MVPYSNTGSSLGIQSSDGNKDRAPQSSTNNTPYDTFKNAYESNMSVFSSYHYLIAYGMPFMSGATAPALPSPTAPVFSPGFHPVLTPGLTFTDKAVEARTTKEGCTKRDMKRLNKQEHYLDEKIQTWIDDKLAEETSIEEGEKANQPKPSSPYAGSVGSWTDDEIFIPNIKK